MRSFAWAIWINLAPPKVTLIFADCDYYCLAEQVPYLFVLLKYHIIQERKMSVAKSILCEIIAQNDCIMRVQEAYLLPKCVHLSSVIGRPHIHLVHAESGFQVVSSQHSAQPHAAALVLLPIYGANRMASCIKSKSSSAAQWMKRTKRGSWLRLRMLLCRFGFNRQWCFQRHIRKGCGGREIPAGSPMQAPSWVIPRSMGDWVAIRKRRSGKEWMSVGV